MARGVGMAVLISAVIYSKAYPRINCEPVKLVAGQGMPAQIKSEVCPYIDAITITRIIVFVQITRRIVCF